MDLVLSMNTPTFISTIPRFILSIALVLSGAIAFTGCDSVGTSDTDGGQLTVLLTDAPGDITKAEVTIERVSVVPSEEATEGDAEEGGIEVLSDESMTVDLLTLQNGVTEMLGEITIPNGAYSQIRLVTAREATVEYEAQDGTTKSAELMLPSADETGIKINFDEFTIDEASDQVEVTLDFNVEESFVKAGQAGKYIFKPVVQAESVVTNEASDAESDGTSG
jgi:hypothetical protein